MVDGPNGFDAYTVDLWNSETNKRSPQVKVVAYFNKNGRVPEAPRIEANALDWQTLRLAYVVRSANRSVIYIHKIGGL